MLSWIWSQLVGLLFSQVIMQRMVCETLPKRCSVWAAVSVMVRLDCSRAMEGLRCTTLMCPGLQQVVLEQRTTENHRMLSAVQFSENRVRRMVFSYGASLEHPGLLPRELGRQFSLSVPCFPSLKVSKNILSVVHLTFAQLGYRLLGMVVFTCHLYQSGIISLGDLSQGS